MHCILPRFVHSVSLLPAAVPEMSLFPLKIPSGMGYPKREGMPQERGKRKKTNVWVLTK
jgi:hypothetical protein